ncbi:hypoxanthine phosphoribosyltransferase [Xylocopilactobacillus apis]|uniref:Hypoxanthine phosphoribosyltransferase n=1 Tax=Xylocopilactobacillus apis TaxID=2932183 RepID=A0AAU9DHN7_9LACO|nr:hypoxanthine phosphoribosyltransferase [Xylocopilactobacillus apis]BDR56247.1 hypoxanthine-guanine phosphoribosyltransferase [Xylocopilactobacillus apis]
MNSDIDKILFNKEEISKKTQKLANQIDCDYGDEEIVTVGILRGALFFMADLLRILNVKLLTDVMVVSSYDESDIVSSGKVIIQKDVSIDIRNRDVLIVEDIVDTGLTLYHVKQHLLDNGAKSVKICTLLDKPTNRKVEITSDYNGFIIPNNFVVGYGLGYANRYRNLDYIGILKPEVYQSKENES